MTCNLCHQNYTVSEEEKAFLNRIKFQYGPVEYSMPESTRCADCRNQVRTSHRNEQYLYNRKSDFSGKQVISINTPSGPNGKNWTVYSQEEWNSDDWDSLAFGRDFDFSRPFFEQFNELQRAVPRQCLITVGNENSPYTTGTGYCKNCHLINSSENCEDCYYGKLLQTCKSSVDCSYLYDSELCYECFSCFNCYSCVYTSYSRNCSDCWFSENLIGCKNCFLCTNLSNKEYYFMNEPLSKEEWHKRVNEFKGSRRNFERAKELLSKLRAERIHKFANITNSENCSGDFIGDSKNCLNCFDITKSEDCRSVWLGENIKDCQHGSNLYLKNELVYETLGTISPYNVAFSLYVFHSNNILYCDQIYHSKNLFVCVGLKKKEYCVFNKQLSKVEYETLVPKIIEHMKSTGEWGQFFPPSLSPHGYNETLANDYYPLSQEQVASKGWNWHEDTEGSAYQGPETEIPDTITEVNDTVTEKILVCKKSGRPYKIMKQELSFYKKMGLPIPTASPDERHKDRMTRRNNRQLYQRQCDKCQTMVESTYEPSRPETIYCEQCYQQAVF